MRAQDQTPDQDHRPQLSRTQTPTAPAAALVVPGAPLPPRAMLALQRTLGNAVATRLVTARRQAHDEAGAHGQHAARAAVTGVLRTAGTPLDTTLRQEMEARLGADFSDVRVHTGAAAHESARSVNALAYTSGSHVVFRRGAYDPASAAGKHVLAHELTHVQQQRRGAVPGTNHDGISVSDPSDAYERAAEANAHRVMRTPERGEPNELEAPGASGPLAVQRNVGVELEDTYWTATAEGNRPIDKFTPLAHGEFFQLQAEFAGTDRFGLEMVTVRGGVRTNQEWTAMCDGMRALANRLDELGSRRARFSTALLPGGEVGYQLTPPADRDRFSPHLQITVGVPLAALPHLFEELDRLGVVTNMRNYRRQQETPNVRTAVEQSLNITPSAELVGFITLLRSYVRAGSSNDRETFLKAIFRVMARTDFASMFSLLPDEEQQAIGNNLDGWVDSVMDGGTADAQLVNAWFFDPQDEKQPPYEIGTTRRQWLSDMADPGTRRDLLRPEFMNDDNTLDEERVADVREYGGARPGALERKKPGDFDPISVPEGAKDVENLVKRLSDIYQGLGGLGNTRDLVEHVDTDTDTDTQAEAVILEIRNPGESTSAIGFAGALERANAIYEAVGRAISGAVGGDYRNVETGGQTAHRQAASDQLAAAARQNTKLRRVQARAAWLLRRGTAPLRRAVAPLRRGGSRG